MKLARFLSTYLIFIFISACATGDGFGSGSENTGYWGSTPGKMWKTGFGDCWKNIGWSEDKAVNCNGTTISAKPEPAKPDQPGYFWTDDQDRDGVMDGDDACPFTLEGVAVDSRGCANDNDRDGVPDYLDECPETPLGNVVDIQGCSLASVALQSINVNSDNAMLTSNQSINFNFNNAMLTSKGKSILDDALAVIKSNTSQNISVEGHTDNTGSDSYNLALSQRRADAVVKYLVAKGVNRSRFTAKGFGESIPVASNDSSVGRALNRRVKIIVR